MRVSSLSEVPGLRAPLRVIQVVNVRWFNATAWYGLHLARLLRKAGHEVLTLGLAGTPALARARDMGLDPVALDLNTLNPLRLTALPPRLRRLLREFRPDVVNCHRGEGMIFWALARLLPDAPSFVLARTRGDQRPPKAGVANKYLHGRLADALIATNSRTADLCRRRLGLSSDNIHTIVGGVDTELFHPDPQGREAARRELGFAPDDQVIALLGRFDPVKGHRELLQSAAALYSGSAGGRLDPLFSRRLRLLLIGTPAAFSEDDIRRMAADAGLGDVTRIVGRRDPVRPFLCAADLGVVASRGSEAIARAALEFMACGVPLVGTDVGVMPDLLPPEALTAPEAPPSALAALLERGLRDGPFRDFLRQDARQRMERLTDAAFLAATLAVYANALARRRSERA